MIEISKTNLIAAIVVILILAVLTWYKLKNNKPKPGFDKNGFETRNDEEAFQEQIEAEEQQQNQQSAAIHIKPMRFRPHSDPTQDPQSARHYDDVPKLPANRRGGASQYLPEENEIVDQNSVNGRRRPYWDPSNYTPRYKRLSKAKLILPDSPERKTFADIAGQESLKFRMAEIVAWHKESEIYDRHHAKMPRGVLLIGPPGNGKTLCAQALAGEIDGSIFIIAGSDFVEMYVGVGASRVRDLFMDARNQRKQTQKPVIIFIDEIDAVGGARSAGGKSNSEQEQALNQLLVEMDGFSKLDGITLVAATNRADMLDKALTRKGRFDLHLTVELPDLNGRQAIIKLHSRNKVLAPTVDYSLLARRTAGMSGADLEAATNEAAIIAARHQSSLEKSDDRRIARAAKGKITPITVAMFDEAVSTVESGEAKRGLYNAMSEDDKEQTSAHELSHALAIVKTGGDPITKITILPRGRALGYVQTHVEGERFTLSEKDLRKRIVCAVAGRIGQQLFNGTVDTGASNDFDQANSMARRMVTQYGMSKLGFIYVSDESSAKLGPALADQIDAEQRRIVSECVADARAILEENQEFMRYMIPILVEKETIFGHDFVAALKGATKPNTARQA